MSITVSPFRYLIAVAAARAIATGSVQPKAGTNSLFKTSKKSFLSLS